MEECVDQEYSLIFMGHQANFIFTIGHSNMDMAAFLKLLADNSIQVVVDVRSAPYSRFVPHFNKAGMENAVRDAGMKYIFMGDAIGGKPAGKEFLDAAGKVLYEKIAVTDKFQKGLGRLTKGLADGWIMALVCAEEDPLKCHRHHLIARELEIKRNIPIWHVRADGSGFRAKEHLPEYGGQLLLFP